MIYYKYQGQPCHIVYEWSGNRVSIRLGTPRAWQGEIVVARDALERS